MVIALKTRTMPADDAVAQSLAALAWLDVIGRERVYFKYCSTFDSTADGNIGPVADALLDALGATTTVVCPASPEHGRTMYQGHLFVGDQLLNESSMRAPPAHADDRPATSPRVLQRQTDGTGRARCRSTVVQHGRRRGRAPARGAHRRRHTSRRRRRESATTDLDTIAAGHVAVPAAHRRRGPRGRPGHGRSAGGPRPRLIGPSALPTGPAVVLAGSCSAATLEQVAAGSSRRCRRYRLDPVATPDPAGCSDRAAAWLREHLDDGPVLIYSSARPRSRAEARAAMGPDTAEHPRADPGSARSPRPSTRARPASWSPAARPPAPSSRPLASPSVVVDSTRPTAACRGAWPPTTRSRCCSSPATSGAPTCSSGPSRRRA